MRQAFALQARSGSTVASAKIFAQLVAPSRSIAKAGDDALVWPEFGNVDDETLFGKAVRTCPGGTAARHDITVLRGKFGSRLDPVLARNWRRWAMRQYSKAACAKPGGLRAHRRPADRHSERRPHLGRPFRVAIARALANDPLLILADAADPGNSIPPPAPTCRRILTDLAHDYGRAVVVVTHDRDLRCGGRSRNRSCRTAGCGSE